METSEPEVQEPAAPAAPVVHENTLKARRFAERFAGKDTEAVIVIAKNGSFALLDMQKPGAYQLSPSNPLNERWREVLRKPLPTQVPITVDDKPVTLVKEAGKLSLPKKQP